MSGDGQDVRPNVDAVCRPLDYGYLGLLEVSDHEHGRGPSQGATPTVSVILGEPRRKVPRTKYCGSS